MDDNKDSDSLMAVYTAYFDALKSKGVVLVSLVCPHCEQPIETEAAPKGEQWDTHSMCPHCEVLFFKITSGNRAIGLANLPFTK